LFGKKDLAKNSPVPWYLPIDTSHVLISSFRLTALRRFFTRNMVTVLEKLGVAHKGSHLFSLFCFYMKEIFTSVFLRRWSLSPTRCRGVLPAR
ncbi:Cycloartenol-C-24-methyltransferase, partial [Striga hermonthica]